MPATGMEDVTLVLWKEPEQAREAEKPAQLLELDSWSSAPGCLGVPSWTRVVSLTEHRAAPHPKENLGAPL